MLPKISYPIVNIKIPSTGKLEKFRPFLVKEEKLLLMAKESGEVADSLAAISQVVNNCALDPQFDVESLTIFDLEYAFLKLRAASVDNVCHIVYTDRETNEKHEFDVDLNKVEVEFPPKANSIIKIDDKVAVQMKYPSASLYTDQKFLKLDKDYMFELLVRCVDKIANGDEVFDSKSLTYEEISAFLESLPGKTFVAMQEFLMNAPSIKHIIKYKTAQGIDKTLTLTSLEDFFTLR